MPTTSACRHGAGQRCARPRAGAPRQPEPGLHRLRIIGREQGVQPRHRVGRRHDPDAPVAAGLAVADLCRAVHDNDLRRPKVRPQLRDGTTLRGRKDLIENPRGQRIREVLGVGEQRRGLASTEEASREHVGDVGVRLETRREGDERDPRSTRGAEPRRDLVRDPVDRGTGRTPGELGHRHGLSRRDPGRDPLRCGDRLVHRTCVRTYRR